MEDFTLDQYLRLFEGSPGGRVIRWQIATSYHDRLIILEEALEDCYSRLVDSRGLDANLSEDQLTIKVSDMLSCAGFDAQHDQHINGHCDLIIVANGGFMWLGEAKVHSSYGWLEDGFLQLSTRYGTALLGRDHGELIIYHRSGDARNVLKEWKDRLTTQYPNADLVEDITGQNLHFRTKHICNNSGCEFFVRHKIVPLQHNPKK